MTWSTDSIPDLSGTRALITGVTGGLGINAAMELAKHGAALVVTARDAAKSETAVARIREAAPGASVDVVALDLADLADVERAAAKVTSRFDRIDILINNAGVMASPNRRTIDGFELQIGTNHIGHFAWTAHLWPLLEKSGTRIVSVSSLAHSMVSDIDLRSLTAEGAPRRYRRWRSYGESKLANLSFAFELDRRLRVAGGSAVSVAAHPGFAATNLTATGPKLAGRFNIGSIGLHQISQVVGQPAHAGAWPLLRAATDADLPGGSYVGPAAMAQTRGRPVLVGATKAARDERLAADLWTASERAAGVRLAVGPSLT